MVGKALMGKKRYARTALAPTYSDGSNLLTWTRFLARRSTWRPHTSSKPSGVFCWRTGIQASASELVVPPRCHRQSDRRRHTGNPSGERWGDNNDGADVPELASGHWTPIAFRPRLASGPVALSWISMFSPLLDVSVHGRGGDSARH
jgi:hypothetical protein